MKHCKEFFFLILISYKFTTGNLSIFFFGLTAAQLIHSYIGRAVKYLFTDYGLW
jgi:hypothetical protein